ncbi:MAG TPA: protein kinase [Ktedonobacterales bacterium]|nr:protein kinase [Ktedonobacterales bacterium]
MESPEIIGGRYRLEEPIGRGGMATIFKAVDEQMMDRLVAVKVLREVYSNDPKFVTRFQREARAASALQHPNIVQVFDYGQSADSYYIVMEYIDGMDLRRYLKRRGGTLPIERSVEIARSVSLGLGAAHRRGIVHRDVKPQNIMVNDEGLVKLTDFGIASMYKDADAERLTTTGMTLGTVQYYAPEQAQGEMVRPSADVYALGIVIYEMTTGHTPFDGDTPVAVAMKHIQEEPEPPRAINPSIPPALERIILKCLAKDPSMRFRDGDELAATLTNFLRSPVRRNSGAEPVPGRGYGGDPYEGPAARPDMRNSGPRPGVYGAAGPVSGPRGSGRPMAVTGRPGQYGGYDEPTYDGPANYDNYGGGFNNNGYGGGSPIAAPTRPWEAAGGTQPRIGAPYRPGDEPEPRRNVGLVAAIIGAVAVVLLVGCILVLALTGNLPGVGGSQTAQTPTSTPVPASFAMPDYVSGNMTCTEAQTAAQQKGLKATCVGKASSQPKNQVIDQSPTAGSQVRSGQAVTLTFSSGLAPITVPNVIGQSYTTAADTLTGDGFTVISQLTPSSKYQAGYVVKTDPPANTTITPDPADPTKVQVTVYVSTGAPTPTPTATSPVVAPTATAAGPTATPLPICTPPATPGPTCR